MMLRLKRLSRLIVVCCLLSLVVALSAPPVAMAQESDIIRERFANANKAYRNKDYSRAYYWWKLLAEAGHAKAQANLALLFLRGQGVDKDEPLALQWMDKAATQGWARQLLRGCPRRSTTSAICIRRSKAISGTRQRRVIGI